MYFGKHAPTPLIGYAVFHCGKNMQYGAKYGAQFAPLMTSYLLVERIVGLTANGFPSAALMPRWPFLFQYKYYHILAMIVLAGC